MSADLTTPERHQIYTKDFDSIGMYLETPHITHYGIDIENRKSKITAITYSLENDAISADQKHLV